MDTKKPREEELSEDVKHLNINFNAIPQKMPSNTLSINRQFLTNARINAYVLSFVGKNEPGFREMIYKYRVVITAMYPDRPVKNEEGEIVETKKREVNLHEGLKTPVAVAQRANVSYVVMEQAAQSLYNFKGMEYAYDRVNLMYSTSKLVEEAEKREDLIQVEGNDKLSKLDTSFFGRPTAYKVSLELVQILNLHKQEDFTSITQFLEILTSAKAYRTIAESLAKNERPKIEITKNKIYFPNESKPFNNDPRILMRGIDKSVRLAGEKIFSPQFILQFDAKTSPFFPEGSMISFLVKLLQPKQFGGGGGNFRGRSSSNSSRGSYRDDSRGRYRDDSRGRDFSGNRGGYDDRDRRDSRDSNRDIDNLEELFRDSRKVEQASAHMKNVVVRTTHLGDKNRIFPIYELCGEIGNLKFTTKNGDVYVTDRFEQKYKQRVNKRLPAVAEHIKSRKETNYYPMEVLEIVPNQRVSVQKSQMEPNLTEIMTRECQQTPSVMTRLFEEAKREVHIHDNNPWLKHFGVKVGSDLIEVNDAVLVPAPDCILGRDQHANIDRNQMNFRLDRNVLKITPKVEFNWCLVDVGNALGRDVDRFLDTYMRRCDELGLRLPRPDQRSAPNMRGNRQDDFDRAFDDMRRNNIGFAIFITRNKTDSSHEFIKFGESKYGILTQQILSKNAQNPKADTLNNIILKTNLKLGGQNWTVKVNPMTGSINIIDMKQCMFIGIGFSSAGPQNVERTVENPQEIETASLAYTVDRDLRLNGDWFYYQKKTKGNANMVPLGGADGEELDEYEVQMYRIIKQGLNAWRQSHGAFPKHVIAYRNGTSEGEFPEIFKREVTLLDKACAEVGAQDTSRTFLVAVTRSNNRIFRIARETNPNDRPPQQNVRAGTAYYNAMTHPRFTEFILQSHRSIQGTGRPVRYVVLNDTCAPRISTEELITITNSMAYVHGVVCSPVSLPSCLYAAQDLAQRAQKHVRYTHENTPKAINEAVRPNVENRFWA
ncbi:unnamed protein product [Bursaphelenchus okinawaensis]|uniref:Piwi domain-containing protein n=1 Tax=Bursaphelenchus okinawaensis TaxID=465554 RepID=A0A811JRV3_9BILA|nr:unnamed protein product [Bursaphelenchus okinawaensis]CAG9080189.1 unnamed protein product [Bursaphelenchus okinawaensis]